jgi:hypothetical protein
LNAFSRDSEERYFVFRETSSRENVKDSLIRSECSKVIEIYDKEPGWLTPGGEGQLKDRYFLEDLFYPHKSDRNNTSRARARTLTYQLTLYFRDTTGHDRLRKLELWFRKDDREKRNEWAHKIQDVRLRIDQLNKQLIRDNQSNLVTVNVPYYDLSECIFPEVQFEGITTTDKNASQVKWDEIPTKDSQRNAKAELRDQLDKWTNQISTDKFYHIRFNENPTRLRNQTILKTHNKKQIAYNIEFINTEGNVCFYFDHTDYRSNGPYQVGPGQPRDFLLFYGFTFTSIPTSTVNPETAVTTLLYYDMLLLSYISVMSGYKRFGLQPRT